MNKPSLSSTPKNGQISSFADFAMGLSKSTIEGKNNEFDYMNGGVIDVGKFLIKTSPSLQTYCNQ